MKTILLAMLAAAVMAVPGPETEPWSDERILSECIRIFEAVCVEENGYKTLEEALVKMDGGDSYSLDLYKRLKENQKTGNMYFRVELFMDMKEYFDSIQYLDSGYKSKEEGISDMFRPNGLKLYRELERFEKSLKEVHIEYKEMGGLYGICIKSSIEFFEGAAIKNSAYKTPEEALSKIYGDTTLGLYKRLKSKPPVKMSEVVQHNLLLEVKGWFEGQIDYKKAGYKSLEDAILGKYHSKKVQGLYGTIRMILKPSQKEDDHDAKTQ